jgi:lysophospholipase L1-like esterase
MNGVRSDQKGREVLFGAIFLLIATGLTLGLGEIVIRVIASRRLVYNVEMVKYATTLKMRDSTGTVSHVHRPSTSAHLMGVEVTLNSLGDRGPELKNPKDANRKRVLVLGSSITLGWGVPFEQTFTSRTEELLNTKQPFGPSLSFEFVNAGIGNYNTHFQHTLFARQYPVVKPDLLVLHYFISDVQPRTMGRDSFILKRSFLAAFLFDRWSQVKLRLSGDYKDLFTFYRDLYADDSRPWRQTQEEILSMRAATAKDSVPFIVMIVPDIHDLSPGTPYKDLYEKIEVTFRGKGLTTVNTFDAFQREFGGDVSKLWNQADDPHPNARGHALMADVLYDYLVHTDPLKFGRAGNL